MSGEQWGYQTEDWELAKDQAKEILYAKARRRSLIPYGQLFSQITAIQFDTGETGRISAFLEEISCEEYAQGRGMLTALVVHKEGDMKPGPGFFTLAERLDIDIFEIDAAWVGEFNKVYNYWANGNR